MYACRHCDHEAPTGRLLGNHVKSTHWVAPDPRPRFWSKVNKTETCWLWTGRHNGDGYGQFALTKRVLVGAHRYAYEQLVGPIPEGLQLDHVKARGCTSTLCVNPAHLEPVTGRENTLRGDTLPARNVAKTECAHGHPYDEANTRIYRGHRYCRACDKTRYHRRTALLGQLPVSEPVT